MSSLKSLYFDIETCGLHGLAVLIQYAERDSGITLYHVWKEPLKKTIELLEWFTTFEVTGFNIAFDWFHVQKLYNVWSLALERFGNIIPEDHINDIASIEADARDGLCIKPASALDLMLYLRKTELQVTMERDDISIRRVPLVIADKLCKILSKKIILNPLLFAGKAGSPAFVVKRIDMDDGTWHPHLCNIELRFRPSMALKAIATHLLGHKDVLFHSDISISKRLFPRERGYAPFARGTLSVSARKKSKIWPWPQVIQDHIDHWYYNELAQKYAIDDIKYTRELHEYTYWVQGGDTNSVLACCVASCRWKGYKIDEAKVRALIDSYIIKMNSAPKAPSHVKEYILGCLSPIELALLRDKKGKISTGKFQLKALISYGGNEEATKRCKAVLEARAAEKKVQVFMKLLEAGRFHASFKVMGTLSDRMSGTDGLNAQGIDKTKESRSCFPLAFDDEELVGGDMQSFEIAIADAVYNDPELRKRLTTCDKCGTVMAVINARMQCPACGCFDSKSFHALYGMGFFKMTYEQIMATKGEKGSIYDVSKIMGFSTLYGAQPQKLADYSGLTIEESTEGFHTFWNTYREAGKSRRRVEQDFTSILQKGKGFEYNKPEETIESLLGHKRWFTLENSIIKVLFELAQGGLSEFASWKGKITRSKKGDQTIYGAVLSAIYSSMFALQNASIRQAANHKIQATGAGITKEVQKAIWGLQPAGVHKWLVRPCNIHDEIQCPVAPGMAEAVTKVVNECVESFRPVVPLIGIDFGKLSSWADK